MVSYFLYEKIIFSSKNDSVRIFCFNKYRRGDLYIREYYDRSLQGINRYGNAWTENNESDFFAGLEPCFEFLVLLPRIEAVKDRRAAFSTDVPFKFHVLLPIIE